MASFVSTMHEWRRMCRAIQWCRDCPIKQFCVIDTEIKNSTDDVFRIIDERVQAWADKNKEPVYPSWIEWFRQQNIWRKGTDNPAINLYNPIHADIAQRLGIEPKEDV